MSNFEDDLLNDDVQWKDTLEDELDIDEEEALLRVSDDEGNLEGAIVGADTEMDNDVEYVDEEGNVVDMTENVNAELYEVKEYSHSEEDGVLCLTQDDDILDVDVDGDLDGTQEIIDVNTSVDSFSDRETNSTKQTVSPTKVSWQNNQNVDEVPPYNAYKSPEALSADESSALNSSVAQQPQEGESIAPDASEIPVTEEREANSAQTDNAHIEDESDDENDERRERFRSERKSVILTSGTKRRTDIPDSLDSVIPVEESAKVDEFLAKERERKLQRKGVFRGRPAFRGSPMPRQPGPCVVPLLPSENREIPVQPVHPTPQNQNQNQQENEHFQRDSNSRIVHHFEDSSDNFSPDQSNIHSGRKILINPHFKGPRPSVSQGILPHPINNAQFREPGYNEPFADIPPHMRGPPPVVSNFRDFGDGPPNAISNQRPPATFRNFTPRFPPPLRDRPVLNNFDRPSNSGVFRHPHRTMGPPLISDLQGPRFLNMQRLPHMQQMHSVEIPGNLYTPFDNSSPNKCNLPVSDSWRIPPNHPPSPHHLQDMPPHTNQHFQPRPSFPPNSNAPDRHNSLFGGFQPRPPFSPAFGSPGNMNNSPLIRGHMPSDRAPHSEFHPPNIHNPPPGIRPLMELPQSYSANPPSAIDNKLPLNQQPIFHNFNHNRNQMFTAPPQQQQQAPYPPVLNQSLASPVTQKRPHPSFPNQASPIKQARIEPRKPIRKPIPTVRNPAVRSSNIKEVPLSGSLPVAPTLTLSIPPSSTTLSEKVAADANLSGKKQPDIKESTDPKPVLEEEEDDPETKELRKKIEEQKKLREEIIRRKEERRRQMAAQRLKDLYERMKEQEQNKIPVTVKNCPTPSIPQQNAINDIQSKPSVKCRLGYMGQQKSTPTSQNTPGVKKRVIVVRKKVLLGPGFNPQTQTGQLTQNLLSNVNPPNSSLHYPMKAGLQRPPLTPNAQLVQVKNLQTTKVLEHIKQMSQNRMNVPPQFPVNKARVFHANQMMQNNFPSGAPKNMMAGRTTLHKQLPQPQRPAAVLQSQNSMLVSQPRKATETLPQPPKTTQNPQSQRPVLGIQSENTTLVPQPHKAAETLPQPPKTTRNPQSQTPVLNIQPQNTATNNMQRNMSGAPNVGRGIGRGTARVIPQKMIRLSVPQGAPPRPQFQPQQQLQPPRPVPPAQASRPPAPPSAPATVVPATPSPPPLPRSRRVMVENLAASTSEAQLSKLCTSVGPIQSIQMQSVERKAVVTFNNPLHAVQFYKKYQRFMLDLSMIQVSLMVS